MTIHGSLDGNKNIKIANKTVGNMMILKFDTTGFYVDKTLPYEICLAGYKNDTFSVVGMQSSDVNLLPSYVEILIMNEKKFVVHPEG